MPAQGGRSDQRGQAPQRRLFIAVLLPPEWTSALAGLQQSLRDAGLRLRYVRPEGIHLTLHFLDGTPETRLEALDGALRRAAAASGPFELRLGAPGTFGAPRRPRVVWAAVHDDEGRLLVLHRAVGAALSAAAFPSESRPFRAHLTLARVPDGIAPADADRLAAAVTELRAPAVAPVKGQQISLMESHLGPSGARYDQLATYPLEDRREQINRT